MKLKNKKTGEIATLTLSSNGEELLLMKNNEMVTRNVKLSDLEEWEDAPEEEVWYLGEEIGNYALPKEEARKITKKILAWKRLKDKGFRIALHGCKGNAWLEANWGNLQGDYSDILLLFGGEE